MSDIDREIELELKRVLDPLAGAPIPARRMVRSQSTRMRALLGGAGAALSVKLLTGVAVAAAAVTVAGTAATGSLDPTVWGQQVKDRVAECRDKLADGQHGIGDCVSSFASQHGQDVASAARQHGSENPNAHGGNPNANDHAKDKNSGRATPSPKGGRVDPEPEDPTGTHPPVTVPRQR
ncbi:MAG TPA: hypothetical protein VGA47_08910 [Candidatus Dormibacteraeota bacterium]